MGRMYSVAWGGIATTTFIDLIQIKAPVGGIVIIHGYSVTVEDLTQFHPIDLLWKSSAAEGSGGSVVTPTPLEEGDAAFSGVVEVGNTTLGGGGASYWVPVNSLVGAVVNFPPERRPVISPDDRWTLTSIANNTSLTFSGECIFEEIGG